MSPSISFLFFFFFIFLLSLHVRPIYSSSSATSSFSKLSMELEADQKKCVGQELDQEDAAVFTISASTYEKQTKDGHKRTIIATVRWKPKILIFTKSMQFKNIYLPQNKSNHKFNFFTLRKVTDPEGSTLLNEKVLVDAPSRDVRMNIALRGVYTLCFQAQGGKLPTRISFGIDFKTRTSRGADPSKKVGKEDMPTLENELKAAEGALQEISREIDFARRQEVLLREAGETTSSRIQRFSILSIAILLTTSVWQIIYLRSFFASKKLL